MTALIASLPILLVIVLMLAFNWPDRAIGHGSTADNAAACGLSARHIVDRAAEILVKSQS